jgi:hypothetical protein
VKFAKAGEYVSAGSDTNSIAIGDLNGDGKPDMVVADFSGPVPASGGVSVFLGNNDGTFQAPTAYDAGGDFGVYVVIADVNGDGHADLVTATDCKPIQNNNCSNQPGTGSVLLGNGDGTFQSATQYSAGGLEADVVTVVDVNGDGHPDVVAVNRCYSTNDCSQGAVGVLLGNGDGTLQSPVTYGSGGYNGRALAVGDLNGDGHLDLVVTHQCQFLSTCGAGGEVGILPSRGDGTFGSAVHYPSQGLSANSSAIADINADGRSDLLVTNLCARSPRCRGTRGSIGVLSNILTVTTTIRIKSSSNPSHVNQLVKFTATLKSASSVPDGSTVIFSDGTSNLGTATTTNGIAALTTSFSIAGTHVITASYPGDQFHTPISRALNQVVNP